MGLFDIFKKKKEGLKYASMLNGYTPIFSQFGTDIYKSDVVEQAVNCIVGEMKKLDPQHIVVDGSDIIPQRDAIQKVLENPNPLMTTSDFIEKVIRLLYANYNAWVCPTWNQNGQLDGLYPLHPKQVDFMEDSRGVLFVKLWFENDYRTTLKYEDLIHIRYNYGVNEFMGGNEVGEPNHDSLIKSLELNDTLLQGVRKALESSFAINGVIKYNTLLDDGKAEEQLAKLTESLKRNESGFMAMDLKGEFIPFTRNIQLVDEATLKFIDEKILRHFGVPLCILTGDYTKDQYEAFYQKTLEPLIRSISQAFTKSLFSKRESQSFGHKIMFYPKDLIFMDMDKKLELIRILGDSGALFENEKRVMAGLRPLPELVGIRKQSLNYVDVDIAQEYQLGKSTTETEEEPDESEEEPNEEEQDVQEDDVDDEEVQ